MNQEVYINHFQSETTLPSYFVSIDYPDKLTINRLRHGQKVLEAQFLADACILVLPFQDMEYPVISTSDGVYLLDPAYWHKETAIEVDTFLVNENFLKASKCETIFDLIDWLSVDNLLLLFREKMFYFAMVGSSLPKSTSLTEIVDEV